MVYTGPKQDVPDVLHLSDMYDGPGGAEIKIKVLRDMGEGNIVDQYIRFCEISDAQRKQYGYTMKAVEETLRICGEENILMPFLASRQKEVRDIMVILFDRERVTEIHEYNLVRDARQEGHSEGREEGIRAMVLTLKEFTTDKAAIVQRLVKRPLPMMATTSFPWLSASKMRWGSAAVQPSTFKPHALAALGIREW